MRRYANDRNVAEEFGEQQDPLSWAADRPLLAVVLVAVAWVVVVVVIASVYALIV